MVKRQWDDAEGSSMVGLSKCPEDKFILKWTRAHWFTSDSQSTMEVCVTATQPVAALSCITSGHPKK